MPSIHTAIQQLKDLEDQGQGHEQCHIVIWKREAKERKEDKAKTKFVLQCDNHETFCAFHDERERIFGKCGGQKSIALFIMLEGWKRMTDAIIDKFLAIEEGPQCLILSSPTDKK